jgi:RHS repeat-associated protein
MNIMMQTNLSESSIAMRMARQLPNIFMITPARGRRKSKMESRLIMSGSIFYYHSDHLGGTNVITDSGGNLVERIRYYPFGEIREGGSEKYSFTGKEKDKQTDFYYFEARYYNPEFKHFTQADTVEPKLYDPQDLNRYSYVRNNPLRLIDPTGHEFVDPSGHKWKSKDNYQKFSKALKDSQKYAEKSARAQRAYMDLLNYYMTALEVPSGLGDMAIAIWRRNLGGLLKSTADTSLVFYRLGFDINGPKSIFELPGYIEGSERMRGIGETVNAAYSFQNLYKLKGQSLDSAKTIIYSTKTVLNFSNNASNFFHWNPW